MEIKNNYTECLTNLACSIRKYFNLEFNHNTLTYVDKILEEKNPKNVVLILCDGMGSKILNKVLNENSFLIKHKYKDITTVFPATTVAATTSIMTGLNPVESGMLGWDMYYKGIDKTITTFFNYEKEDSDKKVLQEAIDFKQKYMKTKSIMDEINEQGQYKAYTLFPFFDNTYKDLDDMYNIIINKCMEDGKKFIYAYDIEPDSTMHDLGSDSNEAYKIIKNINERIENLSKNLEDTIIFVVADHGHKNVVNIDLSDYPDVEDCLLRNTSIEPRAVNFFIKDDKKELFVNLFKKYFGNDFNLYSKFDIIDSNLFGYGEENEIFRDSLGDFLAIGITDKAIVYTGGVKLKSQHAGYTDDEIYVPLIIIDTDKVNMS